MAVPERSLANLQPITSSERARELAKRSAEARRARKASEAAKQAEADDRSRTRLAELAYEALFQALQGQDVPVQARLTAAREALDRLEGKPTQRVEQAITQEGRPYEDMSQDELVARLAEVRLKVLKGGQDESSPPSGPKAHS